MHLFPRVYANYDYSFLNIIPSGNKIVKENFKTRLNFEFMSSDMGTHYLDDFT